MRTVRIMTSPLRYTAARSIIPVVTVLSVLAVSAGPASATKAPAHTTMSAHLAVPTVLVRSTASVTGTVMPAGGTLVLQRLESKTWTTVAHAKPTRTGAYTFSVRAPRSATVWSLRVVRAASSTAKAGTSGTLHLHAVTQQYAVAAASASTVTSPAASIITGVVVPAARGTVQLERLAGATWIAAATGTLGAAGAFSASTTLPVGTQSLRVVKAYSSSVAQGTSPTFTVTVTALTPLTAPAVTTAALPAARVGVPYAALLTATGGNGIYQWSGAGLPAGLTLSPAGLLAGTPTSQGTAALTVSVTDGAGQNAGRALSLTTAPPAGELFAVGDNNSGQLGNGTTTIASTIVPVSGMSSVTAVATGTYASLAVESDGSVWAWGSNNAGELGNGTVIASTVPLRVPGLSGMTAVGEGNSTSYALKSDGTLWAWGSNNDSQIGDGTQTQRLSPIQVSGLTGVVQIAMGNKTAYALTSDGTVWSWGDGNYAELGNGTMADSSVPVQVSGLTGIKQIAAGNHSGYALRANGTVAAWGEDDYNELGDGSPANRALVPVSVSNLGQITQISAGHDTGYALNSSGTVFGWGYNADSELGGATADSPSGVVQIATGALQVAGGSGSGYALLADHSVLSWGENGSSQLGNGGATIGATPMLVTGASHVLSVVGGANCESVLLIAD